MRTGTTANWSANGTAAIDDLERDPYYKLTVDWPDTNNLLSEEDASFEGGTVGNWLAINASADVSSSQSYHGAKSLVATVTADGVYILSLIHI